MYKRLAMLLGLLLSDGSVSYDKSKKTYCIQLTAKKHELRVVFRRLVSEVFGAERFYERKCPNSVNVRAFSVPIAKELFRYSPSFRTLACHKFPRCNEKSCVVEEHPNKDGIKYPPCRIPSSILNKKELSAAFLRGYVSGDGSLYVNKKYSIYEVYITCYHPFLREQLSECLKTLGFRHRCSQKRLHISGLGECKRFLDVVGFIPERKLILSKR